MTWVEARHETTNELVLRRVRYCSSLLCRLRGLMFRQQLGEDEGLLLVGRRESRADAAIHMFFVFFPITVVWLDAAGYVVDVQRALPFRPFYAPCAPAKDVLEGPLTLLERVEIGKKMCFDDISRDRSGQAYG